MQLKHSGYDGSILSNENNFICEGLAANIFMIKDGVLITPSLETGCYKDVLRGMLLHMGKELNMQILEIPKIQQEHLLEMDEIFFVSEEKGVQWVLGIENKRYVHEYAEKLYGKLNLELKRKVDQSN